MAHAEKKKIHGESDDKIPRLNRDQEIICSHVSVK